MERAGGQRQQSGEAKATKWPRGTLRVCVCSNGFLLAAKLIGIVFAKHQQAAAGNIHRGVVRGGVSKCRVDNIRKFWWMCCRCLAALDNNLKSPEMAALKSALPAFTRFPFFPYALPFLPSWIANKPRGKSILLRPIKLYLITAAWERVAAATRRP